VSIWYAARLRRLAAVDRIVHPGVVSVDVVKSVDDAQQKVDEEEERIYRPPTRRPD
jgi:hypothetical protein